MAMSDPAVEVTCQRHGKTPATFVCRHLFGVACGFHDSGAEGDPWPDAWCDRCQSIFERDGEWNEANMAEVKLALLCTACYEDARARNRDVPAPLVPGQLETDDATLRALVHHAHVHFEPLQAEARRRFRFDEKRWEYDGDAGIMRFHDGEGGPIVIADAHIVGSLSLTSNTWLWVWSNEREAPHDRIGVRRLSLLGEVRGMARLAEGCWAATEVDGWAMTLLAGLLLGADALYRAPMDHLMVFMLLRNLRLESPPATG
jgi:hypothetical protein